MTVKQEELAPEPLDAINDADEGNEGSSVAASDSTSAVGFKRASASYEGDPEQKRKRFVWPDALHRDFIAAIFDVGLKHADPEIVIELLERDDPKAVLIVNQTNVRAQVQKMSALRNRSGKDYTSYYEQSLKAEGSQSLMKANQININAIDNNKLALNQKLFLLKKQLDTVNNTINIQTSFLSLVKTSMATQLQTQANIINLISQLDPSYSNSLKNNNQQQQQILSSLPSFTPEMGDVRVASALPAVRPCETSATGSAATTTRVELQIMSEMRSHMDMHRQLMLRKEDQVSQFNGKDDLPVEPGVGDWNWDDDHMDDDHLFSFLIDSSCHEDNIP
jgi:hypothetical protein